MYERLVGFNSPLHWNMGPPLRRSYQGSSPPGERKKGRVGFLSRIVERFAFHVAIVKKGLGSTTRCVEQETSPFELMKHFILRNYAFFIIMRAGSSARWLSCEQ